MFYKITMRPLSILNPSTQQHEPLHESDVIERPGSMAIGKVSNFFTYEKDYQTWFNGLSPEHQQQCIDNDREWIKQDRSLK